jgi:hypothetical protein
LDLSRRIKLNGQFLSLRHLAEVHQVGTNDGYTIRTGEMGHTAASRGGRIRHDRDGSTLEQIRECVFRHIAAEFDSIVARPLLLNGFRVTSGLRVVAPGNHQLRFGHLRGNQIKSLDHQFQTLVGSPFAESQDAVDGRSTPREVGKLWPPGKNAVRSQVDVVAAILVVQYLAIAGHKHRH